MLAPKKCMCWLGEWWMFGDGRYALFLSWPGRELDDLGTVRRQGTRTENVEPNERYVDTPVLVYCKPMTDFEEAHFHEYNITPDRPCSAYFKTYSFMPVSEIFDAVRKGGFKPEHLRCLQRKPTGEVFLTFRTQEIRDAFLSKSAFVTKERSYAINDDEWPIYDAPYELCDEAIIHWLSPYCEVMWYCRGSFKSHGGDYNGLRHYRVHAHRAIPSFLCFGKFQIRM